LPKPLELFALLSCRVPSFVRFVDLVDSVWYAASGGQHAHPADKLTHT
jgi:hypothetical protein